MKSLTNRICGTLTGVLMLVSSTPFFPTFCEPPAVFAAEQNLSPEAVYQAMIALKETYPEGMRWTNDNFYAWKGGIYSGGYGCAGFAFMLSDAAFGNLKAREYFDVNAIRTGDILRVDNDSHSVIVLSVNSEYVTIAEGNYNSSIHWGRKITISELNYTMNYALTRYPEGESEIESETVIDTQSETSEDIPYMIENKITLDFTKDGTVDASDAAMLLVYSAEFGAGNVKNIKDFIEKHGL